MRILGPIISPETLFMWAGQPQTPERRGVGPQLVSYQQPRRKSLLLQKLAREPQRGPAVVAAALY
jgi:hypothetical protein